MKKIKLISIVAAIAMLPQTAGAEIASISCDYETGECRIQGYFNINQGKNAALEVLKPGKTVNDEDPYAYVSEIDVDDSGKYDSTFNLNGSSGEYIVRVGMDNQVFEQKFTFISKEECAQYLELINRAASWDDIRSAFEKDYGKLKAICKLTVAPEDKERIYKTIFDAVSGKNISDFDEFKKIIAEVVLIDTFMGADENADEALEGLFESFSDKYLPAIELWKNSSLTDNDVKKDIIKTLQSDIISSFAEFEEKFSETVIYEALVNVSSKGKEIQILTVVNSLIPFEEYDYFSSQSETKQISILSNIKDGSFGSVAEYARRFDESVDYYKDSSTHKPQTNPGSNTSSGKGNTYVPVGTVDTKPPEKPEDNENTKGFTDLGNVLWAESSIESLFNKNIIQGKAEGIFAPNDSVKREEFASMIVKALGLYDEDAECSQFNDVSQSDWYYKAVASAFAEEIVKGVSDTSFGAGSNITRQDAAVICKNAAEAVGIEFVEQGSEEKVSAGVSYEYADIEKNAFDDMNEVADYAKEGVKALTFAGVINGMGDGSFKPVDNMTRAQAAVIIDRLMKFIEEAKAEVNDKNLEMIDMLSAFGMYSGETEGLAAELSRGEAAKLICEMMNIQPVENSSYSFDDCDAGDEYTSYIYAVNDKGLLKGSDNKFKPDSALSYDDAVSIAVKALGYEIVAENSGGFPDGYYKAASEKNILNGVSATDSGSITKLNFLKLFFNAMEEDVLELKYNGYAPEYNPAEDTTMLNVYKKIYKEKGQVVANPNASIGEFSNTSENEINIGGFIMKNNNAEFDALIGREVTYYYRETDDDEYELVYVLSNNKTNVITLNSKDIEDYSNMTYTYLTDEMSREKQIKISSSVNVIYNNRTIYDFDEEELWPKSGTVEFVDSDGNGVYDKNDVLVINSYKNIVVASADASREIIYDKYSDDYKLDLSEFENVEIKDKDGKTYGLRELREWDVISANISPDNEYAVLTLVDDYAKGKCSYVDQDEMTMEIEDSGFDFSGDFRGDFDEIKSGTNITAYFDMFGNIAAVRPALVTEDDRVTDGSVVVLTRTGINDETGENVIFIKTYGQDGQITYRELEEKIVFNGSRKESEDILGLIEEQVNSAIMISVNENNKVSAITTAAGPGEDENRGFYRLNYEGESLAYGTEASNFGLRFRKGETVYTVPNDAENYGDLDYYSCNTASFINGNQYMVDGYSTIPNSPVASVIVYKSEPVKSGNYTAQSGFVIGTIENRLDIDDNVYKYIEGIDYYCKEDYGTQRGYELDPEAVIVDKTGAVRTDITLDDLEPGDCIRYGANNGKITTVQLVYDYSENVLDSGHTNSAYAYSGYAYSVDPSGKYLTIADGKRPESIDIQSVSDKDYIKNFWIRSDMVTVVDMTSKKPVVKKGTMDDILAYTETKTAGGYSKVVLFSEWTATIYGVVVYIE